MASRTEHELVIKADARAAKLVGQEINKALDPKKVRPFVQETVNLEKQFEKLLQRQIKLNKAIQDVEKGTARYKVLRKELADVGREARDTERMIVQLSRVTQKFDRQQQQQKEKVDREQQQRQVRRQGFVGGLAQGLGVSQYIPTGPEMMPRIGGAMIGGAARRAWQGGTAPFFNPGLGGFAQALGAIPLFGQAAAGALQAASGYYQQTVGYQRSRLQNLYFAGSNMGQFTSTATTADRQRLSEAEAALQGAIAQRESAENSQGPLALKARANEAARLREEAKARQATEQDVIRTENNRARIASLSGGRGAGGAFLGQVVRPAQPWGAGTPLAKARADVQDAANRDKENAADRMKRAQIALDEARRRAGAGYRESGLGTLRLGTELGFDPNEVQGLMGQFFGARGGRHQGRGVGQFREAMAAQRMHGISAQMGGQFYRMNMAGGAGEGNRQMAEILASATAQGLDGSQVVEYMQTLVQLGQRAEQAGVKIDPREFARSTALLGSPGLGLQGVRAQAVAAGLNQTAMTTSQRGIQGPQDMLMLRAAGYDPSQGPKGYIEAINRLEGGLDSGMMSNLLGMMAGGAGGGDLETRGFYLKRIMGRMGANIRSADAEKMLSNYSSTGQLDEKTWASVVAATQAGEAPGARGRLIAGAVGATGKIGGAAVTAAQLTAEQIGVGGQFGPLMVSLQKTSIQTVQVLGNFSGGLTTAAKAVERFISMINSATKGQSWLDKAVNKAIDVTIGAK